MFFASRRTLSSTSPLKFANNFAARTRYVSVEESSGGGWTGGVYKYRKQWLEHVCAESINGEVLIYVHGFNTQQAHNLQRLKRLKSGLAEQGFKGAVIGFDWPSFGHWSAYDGDQKKAEKSAEFLISELIAPMLAMKNAPKVHLFAHSMGGYMIQHGFKHFAKGMLDNKGIEHIAFASADADQNSMKSNGSIAKQVAKYSKGFTNYASLRDEVLTISKAIPNGGEERLGRGGMPPSTLSSHVGLSCRAQYARELPLMEDEDYLSHRWWFQSSGFMKDFALTLAGKDGLSEGTRKIGANGQLELSV